MTSTTKTRLYLILVALLPAATVFAVLYQQIRTETNNRARTEMLDRVRVVDALQEQFKQEVRTDLERLSQDQSFRTFLLKAEDGSLRAGERIQTAASGLDFVELVDADDRVIASSHRSGLIGQTLDLPSLPDAAVRMTVEYDRAGRHAALTGGLTLSDRFRLSGGRFLDSAVVAQWQRIAGVILSVTFVEDSSEELASVRQMSRNELYTYNDRFIELLDGSDEAGLFLLAYPTDYGRSTLLHSLLLVAALVGLLTIGLAIMLGVYITGRSRREIANLIDATGRVAAGDLSTPVMAYEEGEFSQLADSFSEMMTRLKESTRLLAASEKIAAWQIVGRKIAHEIKNPLTPIAISTDDIRRSYQEKLPEFEKTLLENSAMIKSEIRRLTHLLDEFVSFARMRPPEKQDVQLTQFLGEISSLYRSEIESGRLTLTNKLGQDSIKVDPDQLKQLLINLIKNGFEAGETINVSVTVRPGAEGGTIIEVVDDGPGFPDEILSNRFEPQLSSKKEGSGLGLVICQRIVLDHGGRIQLLNAPDGGAMIRMEIP